MASKTVVVTPFESRLRRSLELAFDQGASGAMKPGACRALRLSRSAYRLNDLHLALRVVDRAWRYYAEDAPSIAPIYARLLLLEGREYGAALGMLGNSLAFAPDADAAGLYAMALLQLQRPEYARRQLEAALAVYAVATDDLLAYAATEVATAPAIAASGWMARGADLRLLGEVCNAAKRHNLNIQVGALATFAHPLLAARGALCRPFLVPVPEATAGVAVHASLNGKPLLGSGHALPLNYGLDGRASCTGRTLSGWARIGWAPQSTVTVRLDDGQRNVEVIADKALSAARWGFKASVRSLGLRGDRIMIAARLPDGRWQPLPDSPVLLLPAVHLGRSPLPPLAGWDVRSTGNRITVARRARGVDVIIPVYRGLKDSLACIDSAVATVKGGATVVVVDDATEDGALAAALDARATKGHVTLLRNEVNLGFVGSVNRAMALHSTRDVVLLNADSLVFGDWLLRLREAAYRRSDIGTVTPLSNNATIASYPQAEGGPIEPEQAAQLDELAAQTHAGVGADIPVGVGSCLYLRRDCLRAVGPFDAELFGRGYGEETDFCLRASAMGWTHRLAADVYVYHAGGTSFGPERAALLARSRRLVNLRHPGYDRFIGSFLKQDPLHGLRRRLDERRLIGLARPIVLLVTLALPGGVDRYVAARSAQLRKSGLEPLVLRPRPMHPKRTEIGSDSLSVPNLHYEMPRELELLATFMTTLNIRHIEIQHFLGLDPRVIEAVRHLGVPYEVMVHDYSWVCPRVTLIDGSGRYCGEPAVQVCETCVRRNGSSLPEKITVQALRDRSAEWLRGARRVLAPSADTAARLRRRFPDLAVVVQPHSPPFMTLPRLPTRAPGRRLRVALLGAVGLHKCYAVLRACARDARARELPLEFVVIGYAVNEAPLLATGRVFVTGRYDEAEVSHLLAREQPDVCWIPSVGPETWCYALDHLLRTGLPLVAFDIGAVAERLRSVAGAVLLPLDLAPARLNDRLLQFAEQPEVSENIF